MEKWGETWEDINLERLYIFLREQLAQPDDPWVIETLCQGHSAPYSTSWSAASRSINQLTQTYGLQLYPVFTSGDLTSPRLYSSGLS